MPVGCPDLDRRGTSPWSPLATGHNLGRWCEHPVRLASVALAMCELAVASLEWVTSERDWNLLVDLCSARVGYAARAVGGDATRAVLPSHEVERLVDRLVTDRAHVLGGEDTAPELASAVAVGVARVACHRTYLPLPPLLLDSRPSLGVPLLGLPPMMSISLYVLVVVPDPIERGNYSHE